MVIAGSAVPELATSAAPFDVDRIRRSFPILAQQVRGKDLVYLDNAATTQKPRQMLDAVERYYQTSNANVHRAVHRLSELATEQYEGARARIAQYVNAEQPGEILFVRGATEAINLVAFSYGRTNVTTGDEILISAMEHHSNIVPWQMLCAQTGATLRIIPMSERGELLMDEYARLLNGRTRLVAVNHVSNALGTVNPIGDIIRMAHEAGARVVIDGAQALPHLHVDVRSLDTDFYALSGHKVYGPTGIGALYGKAELLEAMPPWQGGGDMIRSVSFEKTTYNVPPYRFEAGTPDIAGAVGLAAALNFVESVGIESIAQHETELLDYATQLVRAVPGVRIIGEAETKASVLSFIVERVHPHDLGTFLDQEGVAIRTGHHCAQPVMEFYGVPATARASFALYNTRKEIEFFAETLRKTVEILA
ncbi:MAG: SufS family cysteine desulfurase [Candidatus Sumerlaeaceae bacterium]